MIGTPAVTVLINGALVDGSTDARIDGDVVVAPMAPYLRAIADRIQTGATDGRIVLERAGRIVTITIGSPLIRSGEGTATLPIAPYLRAGEPLIPLASVARALGASVDYDAATRTVNVATFPGPLASMTPDPAYSPPAEPLETFTPQPTPAPPVTATTTPRPRRTPIVVDETGP
jgi:hypothetical protein